MAFKYKGDLIKPMAPPIVGLLASDEDVLRIAKEQVKEEARRMRLLFEAHGIAEGDWVPLCYALARTHVAGFRMEKGRRGRPPKWGDLQRAELVLAVEGTGLENIKQATEILAQQEPWQSMLVATRGAETLRDEYTRADPRWVNVLRDARAYDRAQQSIED